MNIIAGDCFGVSVENTFPSDGDADTEDTLQKYAPERLTVGGWNLQHMLSLMQLSLFSFCWRFYLVGFNVTYEPILKPVQW